MDHRDGRRRLGVITVGAVSFNLTLPSLDSRSGPKLTDAPLAGITVVSLEQAVAAPYATRQLADLGARVIKVERPAGRRFRPRL